MMKHKLFCVTLSGCLALSLATTAMATTFTDMPNNYATTSLEAAVEHGLLTGTSDGKILPLQNLTRAEMATIMVRALGGSQEADLSGFSDMSVEAWYDSYMASAVYMEMFQGDGTKLNPTQSITRQEAAVVLARAFHLSAQDTTVLSGFGDVNEIDDWATNSVAAMVEAGFIQGDDQGNFNPTDAIARQDFAVIMGRMVTTYITQSGSYTTQLDGSVMINTADVSLENMTIAGDLIIGDGVGDGDITLNNVVVEGRTIIRGGGVNSIVVKGNSSLGYTVVAKVGGQVRVAVESTALVQHIYVAVSDTKLQIEGTVSAVETTAPNTVVVNDGAVASVSFTEAAVDSIYVVGENISTDTTITAERIEDVAVTTVQAYEATVAAVQAEVALQEAVEAGASEEEIAALEDAVADATAQAESATEAAQGVISGVVDSMVEVPSTSTDSSTDSESDTSTDSESDSESDSSTDNDSNSDSGNDSTGGSSSSGSSGSSARNYYVKANVAVDGLTDISVDLQTATYSVRSSGSGDQSIDQVVDALTTGDNATVIGNILALAGLDEALSAADVTALAGDCMARWNQRLAEGETTAEGLVNVQTDLVDFGIEVAFASNAATILADAEGILYGYDNTVLVVIEGTVAELLNYSNAVLGGALTVDDTLGSYDCTLTVTIVRS